MAPYIFATMDQTGKARSVDGFLHQPLLEIAETLYTFYNTQAQVDLMLDTAGTFFQLGPSLAESDIDTTEDDCDGVVEHFSEFNADMELFIFFEGNWYFMQSDADGVIRRPYYTLEDMIPVRALLHMRSEMFDYAE